MIGATRSLQTRIFNGFTAHLRKDGPMFSVIPFAGLTVIIPDPTEDSIMEPDEH